MDKLLLGIIVIIILVLASCYHWSFLLALVFVANDLKGSPSTPSQNALTPVQYDSIRDQIRKSPHAEVKPLMAYCAIWKAYLPEKQ